MTTSAATVNAGSTPARGSRPDTAGGEVLREVSLVVYVTCLGNTGQRGRGANPKRRLTVGKVPAGAPRVDGTEEHERNTNPSNAGTSAETRALASERRPAMCPGLKTPLHDSRERPATMTQAARRDDVRCIRLAVRTAMGLGQTSPGKSKTLVRSQHAEARGVATSGAGAGPALCHLSPSLWPAPSWIAPLDS